MGNTASSGAKGAATFFESLKRYLTILLALSEGLFYEYFFETANEKNKLFKANFNYAVTKDPFNDLKEYYLSFGTAGRMDGKGFYENGGRPLLNLVIVLDISGSMGSPFSSDSHRKLDVAKESTLALLDQLNENDSFSLICFDTAAYVTQPSQLWKNIDQLALKSKIMEIRTQGGTSLTAGIQAATNAIKEMQAQFSSRPANPAYSYIENRIMFLTDMCPTTNDKDGSFLFELTEKNSTEKINTTFVGIGLDFNTDIVSKIGKIKGCNYLSVNSAKEFKKMMGEDFDYLVTPNVFNVCVEIDEASQKDWQPVRVYGSPGHEIPKNGQLTFIVCRRCTVLTFQDSAFPTQKESDTSTKGGIIVVKLTKLSSASSSQINFRITYEDYFGNKYEDIDSLTVVDHDDDFFENKSIRKAILLTRYVNFFKSFLIDQKERNQTPSVNDKDGIPIPTYQAASKDGRTAIEQLTPAYEEVINKFMEYFNKEMDEVEDPSLERELQTLQAVKESEKKDTTQQTPST